MTVNGAETMLSDVGQLLVGGTRNGSGSGMLTISGGATLSVAAGSGQAVPDAVIGGGSGSPAATATVTGSGSSLTVSGELLVGDTSVGTLSVQSGAHVSAASVTVGGPSDGLIVNGVGSLISADSLEVGARKAGSAVTIAGGTIAVAGNVGLHGTVALSDGGTLASTGIIDVAGATISGQGTLKANHIVDSGRIVVKGGSMTCIGVVTGRGILSAGGDGTISIVGRVASTVGLDFGVNGTFTAASIADLAGTITGFGARDALDFTGQAIAYEKYAGQTLSLYNSANKLLGTETFAGTYTSSNFSLSPDDGSGTLLTYHR
jgi:T5SS/PEP-CTERM-associated repeat protein